MQNLVLWNLWALQMYKVHDVLNFVIYVQWQGHKLHSRLNCETRRKLPSRMAYGTSKWMNSEVQLTGLRFPNARVHRWPQDSLPTSSGAYKATTCHGNVSLSELKQNVLTLRNICFLFWMNCAWLTGTPWYSTVPDFCPVIKVEHPKPGLSCWKMRGHLARMWAVEFRQVWGLRCACFKEPRS